MAFRDFSFPEVRHALGLTLAEADLFGDVPAVDLPAEFEERIRSGVDLALAVNTPKARSEFMIAPVLMELHRQLGGGFGLFSGIEFDVDASRGLNGFCDFILTHSPLQSVLTAPLVVIVEAKNNNIRTGLGQLGQCIAAMVAAREFNLKSSPPMDRIYGVVTTGAAWKFLRLTGETLELDRHRRGGLGRGTATNGAATGSGGVGCTSHRHRGGSWGGLSTDMELRSHCQRDVATTNRSGVPRGWVRTALDLHAGRVADRGAK